MKMQTKNISNSLPDPAPFIIPWFSMRLVQLAMEGRLTMVWTVCEDFG